MSSRKALAGDRTVRRIIVLAITLMAVASPARAASCVLSGTNGEFKVAKIDVQGGSFLSIGWRIFDPIQAPLVDDTGYQTSFGMWVFSGRSRNPRAYAVDVSTSGAPRGRVEVGGQTLFNASAPSTRGTGLHGDYDVFNRGSVSGPDVPPVGVGSGLKLSYTAQYNTLVGALYADATGVNVGGVRAPGVADLRLGSFRTGTAGNRLNQIVTGWPYSANFDLDYYGVDPIASITLLDVDLP